MKLETLVKRYVDDVDNPFTLSDKLKAKLEKKYAIRLYRPEFDNLEDLTRYINRSMLVNSMFDDYLKVSKYYKKKRSVPLKKYEKYSRDDLALKMVKEEEYGVPHIYAIHNNLINPRIRLDMFDVVDTPKGLMFIGDYSLGLELMKLFDKDINFTDGLLTIVGVDNSLIDWNMLLQNAFKILKSRVSLGNILFKRAIEEMK